jgi:hypothetical protein
MPESPKEILKWLSRQHAAQSASDDPHRQPRRFLQMLRDGLIDVDELDRRGPPVGPRQREQAHER